MSPEPERINKLQSYGLTENQAKAYLALLDLGQASASALNKLSGVPRNKVYSVVEELNEKGLVEVVLEDPIVFQPRPFERFLDMMMADLEVRRQDLAASKAELAEEFRVRQAMREEDLHPGTFRLFKGRRAVLHQHRRMGRETRHSVRVLCSTHSVARTLSAGSIGDYVGVPDAEDRDEGIDAEGPQVQVLTPLSEENSDAVARLADRIGDSVRVCTGTPGNVVIKLVDDREVMFAHFVPDSPSLTSGDDIGIWTDNPIFVRLARTLIDQAATGSRSVASAQSLLARGAQPPSMTLVQDAKALRALVMQHLVAASDVCMAIPAEDVASGLGQITAEEQQAIQAGKERMRVLTDAPADVLERYPWGELTEVRRMDDLPVRFVLFDELVLRGYDLDESGGGLLEDEGTLTMRSNLPGAVREARDHFERLWADATPVEKQVPPKTENPVAQ